MRRKKKRKKWAKKKKLSEKLETSFERPTHVKLMSCLQGEPYVCLFSEIHIDCRNTRPEIF